MITPLLPDWLCQPCCWPLPLAVPATLAATSAQALAQAGPGVGDVPQDTQSNASYAASFAAAKVTNVDATTSQVSCGRPEVPCLVSDGPNDGYTGMSSQTAAALIRFLLWSA